MVENWIATNPAWDGGYRDRRIETLLNQPYPEFETVNDSWTSSVPLTPPADLTGVSPYDVTTNDNGFAAKFDLFGSVYSVSYEFSQEDNLEGLQTQLENYVVANWDTAGYYTTYGLDYQPISITDRLGRLECNNSLLDFIAAPLAGFCKAAYGDWATALKGIQSNTLFDFAKEWRWNFVRYHSFFSKIQLTPRYKVTKYATSTADPAYCKNVWQNRYFGGEGFFLSTRGNLNCTAIESNQFSDGLDLNGNRRTVIIGPVDRTSHYTILQCIE